MCILTKPEVRSNFYNYTVLDKKFLKYAPGVTNKMYKIGNERDITKSQCLSECEYQQQCKGFIYDNDYCYLRSESCDARGGSFQYYDDYKQYDLMTPLTQDKDGIYLGSDHAHPWDVIYMGDKYHGTDVALTCSNGKQTIHFDNFKI